MSGICIVSHSVSAVLTGRRVRWRARRGHERRRRGRGLVSGSGHELGSRGHLGRHMLVLPLRVSDVTGSSRRGTCKGMRAGGMCLRVGGTLFAGRLTKMVLGGADG